MMNKKRYSPGVAALILTFLLAPRSLAAQEIPRGGTSTAQDISFMFPALRGLDFCESKLDIVDKGLFSPELSSLEGISIIAAALAWLGTPYMFGGFSRLGVDCSGFLYNVLESAVPKRGPFPRRSDGYASFGLEVAVIEPGDILLFAQEKVIYHVGLALSTTTFIHSASEGARTGVIISSLYEGTWNSRLFGIRRF
jgi:hypothetical protein